MNPRPFPFFSLAGPAPEETDHFGRPEDRAREAENIRLEYIESKKTGLLPGLSHQISRESPYPTIKPQAAPYTVLLKNALEEVDYIDLNLLLGLVLTELRTRESEQIKEDILTHSKKLRFDAPPEESAPFLEEPSENYALAENA